MTQRHQPIDETALIERLERLPLEEPPGDLTSRVMSRIGTRKAGLFQRFRQLLGEPCVLTFRPLYACVFAVFIFVSFLLGRMTADTSASRADAVLTDESLGQERVAQSAEAAYLLGRGLLALERREEALPLLRRAASLEPQDPEYAYWEGIGYWANGDSRGERASYLRGLTSAPDHPGLLINLGHNLLADNKYEQALEVYRSVLDIAPETPVAWYNSGLIYRELGRVEEEKQAWREYLLRNRIGTRAFRAVERLNAYGDFSYRTYQIGVRNVILAAGRVLDETLPDQARLEELTPLVRILSKNKEIGLEVIVFVDNDIERARNAARTLKRLLVGAGGPGLDGQIKTSWFDSPEIVRHREGGEVELSRSLLLFSTFQEEIEKEVSI